MQKKKEEEDKYVKWISSLHLKDVPSVGGKAANLGEMYNLGLPVPQGFVILAKAYSYFLEKTGLKEKIYNLLKINVENTEELENISKKIKELIENSEMPKDLEKEIIEAYDLFSFNVSEVKNITNNVLSILKTAKEPVFVAVRSSATAEDSPEASFAGANETFINVKGQTNLIESVKKCFASLFTPRSIYYRIKKGFKHENVLIAVIVQLMVNSDKSGVIFSKDPVEENENVVIEAVYGLGEGIVSGRIEPDHYLVDRELNIVSKKIAEKKVALVRNSEGNTIITRLTEERSRQQVLSDYEIKKLADYALKLEEHYKKPQDIEFAISSKEIHIVQTRPITTLGKKKTEKEGFENEAILTGLAASPGIGSGEVKLIKNLQGLDKIKKGDILVTEMTNPDMVVSMQKASAIVTDEGGSTCHAAIVSREMGIPAVVGTKKATKILKDGMIITVDGFKGKIYEGKLEELKAGKVSILPVVETKTKIKVIVDLPDFAYRAAKTKCKDVGLTRLEGIIAESGKHPFYFLESREIDKYEEIIFSGIKKIAEYFDEIWVRTSDIRSDEFRHLQGSPRKIELNPMLGMHGIRAGLKYPEILKAEIKALARVKKAKVMMPQVISVEEVKEVKKILKELGLDVKLGVMIETPAAVQVIEELCKEGISFISFGTNDLTQFTLAIDRGNEDVQYLYNEMNPAVLSQLAHVISVCKKYNVETSICGQAASTKPMVEFLVRQGIDSLSVNADKAFEISEFVKELESRGLKTEVKVAEKTEKPAKEKSRYNVNCSRCGKNTEVPFKPDGIRPVYCKICLEVIKQEKLAEKKAEEKPVEAINKIKQEVKEISSQVLKDVKKEAEELAINRQEVKEEVKEKSEKIKETVKEEIKELIIKKPVEEVKEEDEEEIRDEEFYEENAEKIIESEQDEEELDIF